MHVCHFCSTSVESAYFKNISKGLVEKGVDVSMVELGSRQPPTWLSEVPEVKYFSLGITGKKQYPLAVWRLARLLSREKIDILQTHLYDAGLIAALAKKISRKTIFVYMRHHTSIVRMLGKNYHVALDRWMAEKSNYVMTVSKTASDYMTGTDKIRQKVEVSYLGIDFDDFAPNEIDRKKIRAEFDFAESDFVIGYIGNLLSGKGHLQLIQAFEKIIDKIPEAKLFLVGRGKLAELDEAVEKAGLEKKVVFSGWRSDTSACLNAMDLFAQGSLSESFSQVLIEAMGVGLPIIATDVGVASEIIINGENGFTVEIGKPELIYQRALEIYNTPELSEKISLAGRKKVLDDFTIDKMVDRHYKLYKQWLRK